MKILLPCRRCLTHRLFLLLLLIIPLTIIANTQRIYMHFIGDSITQGMLNNSYLNGNKVSTYGGYRGELFQYLMQMAAQPQKADWPRIMEDDMTKQLYVIGKNGIKYQLITLGANITPTNKEGPYQVTCKDKRYLICQKPELYANNDGRSGETSTQVLTALAANKPSLLDFYRDYKIQPNSELLTTILLGTNDLLQYKDATTANNIKAIVNASVKVLKSKITRFAFVISTIPDAEVYLEKGYNVETINKKIQKVIAELKVYYQENEPNIKVKFFFVNLQVIKTPKNDPDFPHPGQEGWGSVHPSYYQYRVMACNLLFANTFSASKIVRTRYDEITRKEIPLTASKHDAFPLTTIGNAGCVIPATPQGLLGALNFLTDGKTPPVEDSIRWYHPDITINKISDENTISGRFNPAEVLPVEKKLNAIYQCAINNDDSANFKNCNIYPLPNGKVGFILYDLKQKIDKTLLITAIHPQYPNVRSQTYTESIPWPKEPQLFWDDADLKVDAYDLDKKKARVSFKPACIKLDTEQSCKMDQVQYRWWITASDQHSLPSVDKHTVIRIPLNNDKETLTIEAFNTQYNLQQQKSIVIKKPTPSKVVLQCPDKLKQMSTLVAKGDIDTHADQYKLLKVPVPELCNFSANKTSCILADPKWPKLLCYDTTTKQAYQAARKLYPEAINKKSPDCTATENGTFSGSNCRLSW